VLEANLGQEMAPARPINLQPYEGKSVFLDVAQLPQFYGVRILGACDSELGQALWESSWDRGDFVVSLVEHAQKTNWGSKVTTDLQDPTAAQSSKDASPNFTAGDVRHGVFRQFQKGHLNAGPLEVVSLEQAFLDQGEGNSGPSADHLSLAGYEGKAVFFSEKSMAKWATKKGDSNPGQAFVGVHILGSCDHDLGSALWAASTDRGESVLAAARNNR